MIPSQLQPLANHLWQSTLFAAVAGLLTLAVRKNRAETRYWLWLAASVKFLIPFSVLVDVGNHWGRHAAATTTSPVLSHLIEQTSQPFSTLTPMATTTPVPASPLVTWVPAVLSTFWAIGFATLICSWWRRWRGLRAALRTASPLDLQIGIDAMISPAFVEPGVFGIWRPVLLLPAGITDRLTPPQLKAIVAHELCHIRRRDNLATAIHMGVEALFWFHPLVWWLGARLMEERERACDEEVLLMGSDPQTYAEGILKICELYLESPLPCVAGVTGANLRKRIEEIMSNRIVFRLNFAQKLSVTAAAIAAIAAPLIIGMLHPPEGRAQTKPEDLTFEVASVKPASPDTRGVIMRFTPGGGVRVVNGSMKQIILLAYNMEKFQISGGPGWVDTERFDIIGKAPGRQADGDQPEPTAEQQQQARQRLQSLLVDRFHLTIHRETREAPIFVLVVSKKGPKLRQSEQGFDGISGRPGQLTGEKVPMPVLASVLSGILGRPVLDQTGLVGTYAFKLEWTPDSGGSNPIATEKAEAAGVPATDPSGPSLFNAIQEQLGLRLEPQKGPVSFILIDQVERPSAN